MEVTLKFERAILLDSTYDFSTLRENEAVIGQINGKMAIMQYLTDEQWEDIKRQGKQEYLEKRKAECLSCQGTGIHNEDGFCYFCQGTGRRKHA